MRYRRARGELRQQLRWVAVAFCTAAVLVAVGASLWGAVPGIELVPALGVLVLPAGVAVAILRYRLYDLDLVVNRTAVYAVLTAGVVACYVLVVGLVGCYATGARRSRHGARRDRCRRRRRPAGAGPFAAAVNRLMYGERDDPYLALSRVGRASKRPGVAAALPGHGGDGGPAPRAAARRPSPRGGRRA